MTNTLQTLTYAIISGLLLTAFVFTMIPNTSHAATFAYVDAQGDVKSVTANDWMTAIAIAPNINIHSGVMLLLGAADYTIVGKHVTGV